MRIDHHHSLLKSTTTLRAFYIPRWILKSGFADKYPRTLPHIGSAGLSRPYSWKLVCPITQQIPSLEICSDTFVAVLSIWWWCLLCRGVVVLGYFYHPEKNADSFLLTSCKVKVGLCGIDQVVQQSDGFFKEINILKVQVNDFLEKQLLKARCKYLYFSPFPTSINANPRPESGVSVGLDWCTMVALCTSLRLPPRFPALHLLSLDEHHPWQLVPSQSQPSPSATSPWPSTPPSPTS